MMTTIDRREFVLHAGAAGIAATFAARAVADQQATATPSQLATEKFCAFTESFQSWPIDDVCGKFKSIGLDGLDLTVRPGGHIEPEDAPSKLPAAVKAADAHGVKILMLSTAVTDASPVNERLVAATGDLGIDRIKLGYFRYEGFGTLLQQIDAARRQIASVAKLCSKHGVLPCVHIHCGSVIPSSGPIAYLLLRDFLPDEVGAYVDPMHLTLEGGIDGWRQGLDLLAPWIALSSIKNAKWELAARDSLGQQRWVEKKCPIADGVARMPEYFATLRQLGYRGLYTLHSEYQGDGSWKNLNVDECLSQTEKDLRYARKLLAS